MTKQDKLNQILDLLKIETNNKNGEYKYIAFARDGIYYGSTCIVPCFINGVIALDEMTGEVDSEFTDLINAATSKSERCTARSLLLACMTSKSCMYDAVLVNALSCINYCKKSGALTLSGSSIEDVCGNRIIVRDKTNDERYRVNWVTGNVTRLIGNDWIIQTPVNTLMQGAALKMIKDILIQTDWITM